MEQIFLSGLVSFEDYDKYRGKCKEFSEALIEKDSSLRLVRGFYFCPIIKKEEMHWWCEAPNGEIIDPTRKQFPSTGEGTYREFDGWLRCSNCDSRVHIDSKNIITNGRHAYCGDECYKDYVGCE